MANKTMKKDVAIHIGRNIRKARLFRGVKQQTLASALGINQCAISEIEQKEQIEEQLVEKIAQVLALPVKFIKNFNVDIITSIAKCDFQPYYEDVIKSFQTSLDKEINKIESLFRHDNSSYYHYLESPNHLGKKIEAIRRFQNTTQTELAKALGVTKQAVSKMEHTEKIENQKIKRVAKALGVSEAIFKQFNGIGELSHSSKTHDRDIFVPSQAKMKTLLEDVQALLKKEIEVIEKLKQTIK